MFLIVTVNFKLSFFSEKQLNYIVKNDMYCGEMMIHDFNGLGFMICLFRAIFVCRSAIYKRKLNDFKFITADMYQMNCSI